MGVSTPYEGGGWAAGSVDSSGDCAEKLGPPSGPRYTLASGHAGLWRSQLHPSEPTGLHARKPPHPRLYHICMVSADLKTSWWWCTKAWAPCLDLASLWRRHPGSRAPGGPWKLMVPSAQSHFSHAPSFVVDKHIPQSTSCVPVSIPELVSQGIHTHYFYLLLFYPTIFLFLPHFPYASGDYISQFVVYSPILLLLIGWPIWPVSSLILKRILI